MASSTIRQDVYYLEAEDATVANSYVSPFGAYDETDFNIPQGYKAVSATLIMDGATNPASFKLNASGKALVYSKSPASYKLRVTYVKN